MSGYLGTLCDALSLLTHQHHLNHPAAYTYIVSESDHAYLGSSDVFVLALIISRCLRLRQSLDNFGF